MLSILNIFRVVEQLLALASDIHLTLCINNLNDIEHEAPTALFHRQFNVFQQINNMAKKISYTYKDNYTYSKSPP